CQKDAFLCAARGVSLGIYFQQKLSVGFFGGEGFIMQKLDGDGLAFVHAGGTIEKRELQAGQTLLIDTGCIVALTPNVSFEIQYVGKIKTALFGGEGLFFAKMSGPGTVWLQSLPFSRLASRVFAAAPQRGGSREEGSVLGGFGAAGLLGGLLVHGAASAASVSVLLDELTSPEVRERIAAGATTILLPIGGTEQSGAHMALGKHNARAAALAQKIAQRLGQTLV